MKYRFKLQETNSPEIELEKSFWMGMIKVYIDGKEIEFLKEKGKPFPIPMGDGTVKKMLVKGRLDDLPKVIVDEKEIMLARKLFWYEYALGFMPAVLLMGGALGGFFGVIGVIFNFKILRFSHTILIKSLFIIGITVLSFFCYVVSGNLFYFLLVMVRGI